MSSGVFTTIDGKAYVHVDGYFSSDMKTKIPFDKSGGHEYLVRHMVNPESILPGDSRAYYRRTSVGVGHPTPIDAIFTSTNFVKKVISSSNRQ